jgi:hypothetical protein
VSVSIVVAIDRFGGEAGVTTKKVFGTVAAVAVLLVSSVAVAEPATTLTGTSDWGAETSTGTTTMVHGTFGKHLGKGTYAGTLSGGASYTTYDCGPVCQPVTGTITFSTKHGTFTVAAQSGSFVRLEDTASHSWRYFTLSLVVVGGTGSYAKAHGMLALSYTSTWEHDFVDGVNIDEVVDSGTLTGKVH